MKIPNFDAATSIDSPIGNINLFAEGDAVVFLDIGQVPVASVGKSKVLVEASKQLDRYFHGKSKQLDFKVKLEGTKFQQAVRFCLVFQCFHSFGMFGLHTVTV